MSLGLQYKDDRHIFDEAGENVPYLEYPMLRETGIIRHGFSTRLGGVSEGCWASMNLSFERGDRPEAVMENFRRIGAELGVRCEDMVLSQQTHTANVRVVTGADRGKGITRERDYTDVDGLITNEPGICLVTSFADCVPLYFVDPVHHAIGLSHSGWRGTVHRMGRVTLKTMKEAFGTKPEDVICAIGPSICQSCFEVGGEVIEEFQKEFDPFYWKELFYAKENGKYQLDLWKANEIVLLEAGIQKEKLQITDICTRCNPEYLFSHRIMGNERGNLAAFLGIR